MPSIGIERQMASNPEVRIQRRTSAIVVTLVDKLIHVKKVGVATGVITVRHGKNVQFSLTDFTGHYNMEFIIIMTSCFG